MHPVASRVYAGSKENTWSLAEKQMQHNHNSLFKVGYSQTIDGLTLENVSENQEMSQNN
jgi:hypothetical protein